jgi:hypothetical protein
MCRIFDLRADHQYRDLTRRMTAYWPPKQRVFVECRKLDDLVDVLRGGRRRYNARYAKRFIGFQLNAETRPLVSLPWLLPIA